MKIELLSLTENEDGSADMKVELDEEAKILLIQAGLETLITRAIDKYKEESNES
jgi:hypothetical protein